VGRLHLQGILVPKIKEFAIKRGVMLSAIAIFLIAVAIGVIFLFSIESLSFGVVHTDGRALNVISDVDMNTLFYFRPLLMAAIVTLLTVSALNIIFLLLIAFFCVGAKENTSELTVRGSTGHEGS